MGNFQTLNSFLTFGAMDFERIRWNIKSTPDKDLFDAYNDLFQLYSETCQILSYRPSDAAERPHAPLSPEQVVKLVIYAYHQYSPFAHEPSMHKRRLLALREIGYSITTEADIEGNKVITAFIVGDNTFVNHLAIRFCKQEPNSFDWLELCRLLDMIDDVYLTLKAEQAGAGNKGANEILKVKLAIDKDAMGLRQRATDLANKIFNGDERLINTVAIHDLFEKRISLITPQRIVKAIRDKANAE